MESGQVTAVTKELTHIRKKMEELSKQNHATGTDELEKLQIRMDEVLYREKMMWLQRSRIS
jgi:ElaB/YqjD/DUF883 family membrane-anchored ribosome-binding protein